MSEKLRQSLHSEICSNFSSFDNNYSLFFDLSNLTTFKTEGIVIIINMAIKIKSKDKLDTPYFI